MVGQRQWASAILNCILILLEALSCRVGCHTVQSKRVHNSHINGGKQDMMTKTTKLPATALQGSDQNQKELKEQQSGWFEDSVGKGHK